MVITSRLLGAFRDLAIGMSTRLGGVSPEPYGMNLSFMVGDDEPNVERNRSTFFEQMGVEANRAVFAGQIHSAHVVRADAPGRYPDCDGLVTNTRGIYCCISVADCIPLFLFDPNARVVAAVHAGWRGTAAGIARNAVDIMREHYHVNPSDIRVFIGPGAGSCCYEVGPEVSRQFPQEFVKTIGEKSTLDLKQANARLLMEAGLEEDCIEISPECTICNSDLHSFRRDGRRSGRMMGIIGMH